MPKEFKAVSSMVHRELLRESQVKVLGFWNCTEIKRIVDGESNKWGKQGKNEEPILTFATKLHSCFVDSIIKEPKPTFYILKYI